MRGAVLVCLIVLIVYLFERRKGVVAARYATLGFFVDSVYALFYRSGLYTQLVYAATANALEPHLEFLKLELLPGLPLGVQLAIYVVGFDLILYWIHRLQHANKWFWAFHTIHHSQERLTTLTQYRRHPLEFLYMDLISFVIFVLVLGIPTATWLPLWIVMTGLQALQHAELDWRLGPLYKVVVSPVFHSIHHSPDAKYYNKNLGLMLSVWDFVFGTAAAERERPGSYGISDVTMAESLTGQLVAPFRLLRGWRRSK